MTLDLEPTDVTQDRLLGGRIVLHQPAHGYRAAIDPVLLAAAAPARPGDSVVDLGCGVGAAFLCLDARVTAIHTLGVDSDPAVLALARLNVEANGVSARAGTACADVAALPDWVAPNSYDVAICNPPYLERGRVTLSDVSGRRTANVEGGADLEVWITAAHRVLRPKGRLALIHRADRVDTLCAQLAHRFGDVEIIPLWPKPGAPARRVIVRARKNVRSPARLMPGLVLHHADGRFTGAATAILSDGADLDSVATGVSWAEPASAAAYASGRRAARA